MTGTDVAEALRSRPGLRRGWPAFAISPPAAYAIRFAVAVTAAIWIGKAPGLVENNSTWILITVLMVLQPTTGGSLVKGLLRALGTALAAFTSILLFGLFAQDPLFLMAGLFLVEAVAAYGFSGSRFQYAWFVWGFTTAIVLGDAMAGQGAVETLAFQRASMVGIGILLVLIVDSLLWPARAETRLRQSLASSARRQRALLRISLSPPGQPDEEDSGPPAPNALSSQLALVNAVRAELGLSRAMADGLARVVLLLETLDSRTRVLATPIDPPHDPDAYILEAQSELGRRAGLALDEIADALAAAHAPKPFSDAVSRALLVLEEESDRLARRGDLSDAWQGRIADLRDLVAVLRRLETALSGQEEIEKPVDSPWRLRFRPDPFRMKIAIRTGIAVVTAFLAVLSLGWPMNSLVGAVSFMLAVLTRGKALQTLIGLAATVAFGWLLADLLIVYVTPYAGRAPLALVAPFSCAAALAYIAARRPALAMLPSIGGLVAILSVFGGTGAATDVYGAYSLICYLALAIGVGWLFSRVMWPATAAGLFRQRLALQLAACLEAFRRARQQGAEGRARRALELIRICAVESAQLGPLHDQARHEPVERALVPDRRTRILALVMDLMDATLGDRPAAFENLSEVARARLEPLLEAIRREEQALLDSLQAVVAALRGDPPERGSGLAEARRVVEGRLDELRRRPSAVPELSDEQRRGLLVALDARRRLVFRQHAIEEWLADWRRAEQVVQRMATREG